MQGQRDSCYSHAAADLLNDYLNRHPKLVLDADFRANSSRFEDLVSANAIAYGETKQKRLEYYQLVKKYQAATRAGLTIDQIADSTIDYSELRTSFEQLKKRWPLVFKEDGQGFCESVNSFEQALGLECEKINKDKKSTEKWIKCVSDLNGAAFDLKAKCEMHANNRKNTFEALQKIQSKSIPVEFTRFSDGGSIPGSLGHAQNSGICFERQIRSQNFDQVTGIENLATLLQNRLQVTVSLNETIKDYHMYAMQMLTTSWFQENLHEDYLNDLAVILRPIFPMTETKAILKIISKPNTELDPLSEISELACAKKVKGDKISRAKSVLSFGFPQKQQELIDLVHTTLLAGRSVAIGYNAVVLRGPNFLPHASILLEGREQNGEWTYRLRNSWGAEACEKYKDLNPGNYTCDKGDFIISEKLLGPHLIEAVAFQD
jgi:hypothetical protein